MSSDLLADPFRLFPEQAETCKLLQLGGAPGIPPTTLSDSVLVIIKRATGTGSPGEYDSRNITRRLHIKPDTLPAELASDPEQLVDLVFETKEHHYYKVVDASRGDDMDMGELRFVVATCMPWGRNSL